MDNLKEVTFSFDSLKSAPLKIDAIYESGSNGNVSDDPISKLLHVGNRGGFRKSKMNRTSDYAYIVIHMTGTKPEWPDFFDRETGVFRYYGDNRQPGNDLHNTKIGGNKLLRDVFTFLNECTVESLDRIPPFLIFEDTGVRRDVRFIGMAVPGVNGFTSDKELVSFWRTYKNTRFQNYEAYFTVINECEIDKEWLEARRENRPNHRDMAPRCWKRYVSKGRNGIEPFTSRETVYVRSRQEQCPIDRDGLEVIRKIHDCYADNPTDFEWCATKIVQMMDSNFVDFQLTRPWRDGGRDAIGSYRIGYENSHSQLKISVALEAKCYKLDNGVDVHSMSRLISRIKYREAGIFVTTSYISDQAYKEVIEDGHPILMVTSGTIVEILKRNGINSQNVDDWLDEVNLSYADF